jgi:hypothetical protein
MVEALTLHPVPCESTVLLSQGEIEVAILSSQCLDRHSGELAVHDRRRSHQAQAPLPLTRGARDR